MGRIVIAVYRAKPGQEAALHELVKAHVPILRSQSLVTEREPIVMKSGEATYIEIFEWQSQESIEAAHANKAVQKMWEQFGKVCDYIPISEVEESRSVFSEFTPVDFD